MDAAAFGGFDRNDFAAMDSTAFGGFGADDIGQMDAAAFGGFDRNDFAAMDSTAFAGFGLEDIGQMDAAAFGGFDKNDFIAMDSAAFAGFGSEDIQQMDPFAFAGFDQNDFMAMSSTAFAGFDAADTRNIGAAAMDGFSVDSMSNMTLDAMAGFGREHMEEMDIGLFAAFDDSRMAALDGSAINGFNVDHLAAMGADLMDAFTADHMQYMAPDLMDNLTADQFAAMDPLAMAGFGMDHMKNLPADAISFFTPAQMGNMAPDAMSGFTPQHITNFTDDFFAALTPTNMGGFDPLTIKALPKDKVLEFFTPAEFQQMPAMDMSKMFANFDPTQFTPADVSSMIPDSWLMDPTSGKITPPPGTPLALPPVDFILAAGIKVPSFPDLSKEFALGGEGGGAGILDGMNGALAAEGFDNFLMSQTDDGVIKVEGSGDADGVDLAFIPDMDAIKQAPEGFTPGLGLNQKGQYELTTASGELIPILPAPADLDKLATIVPGGEVVVGDEGEVEMKMTDGSQITGIFDPFVSLAPTGTAPGIHKTGEKGNEVVTVVYEDGTQQTVKPTIHDQDSFVTTALAVDNVESVEVNTDGTIDLTYAGVPMILKPVLQTTEAADNTIVDPVITVDATGMTFTSADGDVQEFVLGE